MHEVTYRNPFSAEILPALGLGIDQRDPWKAIHVEKGQFGPWCQHLQSGPHTLRHVKPYVKTRLWLPLSAPPHTSPVPTSQSCEISDLEASLEQGPEAREAMAGEQPEITPLGQHSPTTSQCLWIHAGPVLYGQVRYLEGKGLHEFVSCLQVYHLTWYLSLPLQVSQPASMLCNTTKPNCTVRTPKSCMYFLSLRYSWHKISQCLFFKAGFPLHLPTGCSPKPVILSKKSSTGWPSNIGHRKGSL